MDINALKAQLAKLRTDAQAVCDVAIREDREFTAEERTTVEQMLEDAKAVKAQIDRANDDAALIKSILDMGAGMDLRQPDGQHGNGGGNPGGGQRPLSLGEQFVNSEDWKAYLKFVAPDGHIPDRARLSSPAVTVKGLGVPGRKDVVTGASDTSAGAFVQTDYTGIYEALGRWPLSIRDLISVRQTTSDLVEFVRQTSQVTEVGDRA